MIPAHIARGALALAALVASADLGVLPGAQAPPRPELYVLRNVTLGRAAAEDAPPATVVLRNGRIESVLDADASVQPGAREVDGAGLLALPAFIDAYTRTGCETPEPAKDQDQPVDVKSDVRVDMRLANRKGIQPAFRAVEALKIEESQAEAWRESGFGTLLSSPGGELLAGTSVLATTRDAAMRDVVVRPAVFAHAAFRASGSGYPSTLMGYIAQLRQFLLDVQHHDELVRRYEQGRPGLRPPFDEELEAARTLLEGQTRLVCEAETARDIERWIKLADAFGLEIAISGGGEAWKVAEMLAVRDIPVLLTVDWGEEVDDPAAEDEKKKKKGKEKAEAEARWEYREPLGVRTERRRLWEEKRDCAIRLREAGVRFAFGTGKSKPKETLKKVRTLVESGLPADAALEALTSGAAGILGVDDRLGRIEPGHDASLVLWDGDPLTDEKASPAWMFVDGFAYEFERKEKKEGVPDEGVDVTGTWTLTYEGEEGPSEATLVLEMSEDGAVTGKLTVTMFGDVEVESDVEGQVIGKELEYEGSFAFSGEELSFTVTATIEGDEMSGTTRMQTPWSEEPSSRSFDATRNPETR